MDLSDDAFSDLDRIPPEIAGLTALLALALNQTKISDLSPLRGLTALQGLWLDQTTVSDLSPLRRLTALHRKRSLGTTGSLS